MIALKRRALTDAAIARQLGVTDGAVSWHLRDVLNLPEIVVDARGWRRPTRYQHAELSDLRQMAELRSQGLSFRAIGREMGFHHNVVISHLREGDLRGREAG